MSAIQVRAPTPQAGADLVHGLGVHPVTAQLLAARGVAGLEQARRFLNPGPHDLHDPRLFRDMERATGLLEAALQERRRIAVYGDYDVDGVAATAVMTQTLELLGGTVHPYIPHRIEDGYGLNGEALLRLREQDCRFVVTVDNGTSRAEEIERARAAGMELVVTDHHEPGAALPDCPVINPKRADSAYPFAGLAGCGVALKLALALVERLGRLEDPDFKELLRDLLAFTAIGTVADVVPLLDENRSLVHIGLRALSATRRAGLRALLEVARCAGATIRPTDVAFRIGPRINAAGRLGSADLALELLLCRETGHAGELAKRLDACNRERQRLERAQAEEALERAEQELEAGDSPALVLADPGWHPGIIGIVAARVAETFRRPAALITIEGEVARGSARCFGDVALHEVLEDCSDLLVSHGGHARAAGFTLASGDLDRFRERFLASVASRGGGGPVPTEVDAELPLDAITLPLAREIESLQPFGTANPEPLFCAFGVRVAGRPRRVGANEQHLAFYAATDRSAVRAVAFNQADREPLLDGPLDLAYVLRRRSGPEPIEIHVRRIEPAG